MHLTESETIHDKKSQQTRNTGGHLQFDKEYLENPTLPTQWTQGGKHPDIMSKMAKIKKGEY